VNLIRLLKRDLSGEAQGWVDREIITKEQGEEILAIYGTALPTGEERSRGYYVLLSLAVLFAGLAVLLIVSANWDDIPRGLRMSGLIGATALANLVGLRLHKAEDRKGAAVAFFFGCLLYGASIMLIAQIYHLGEHFPDGVYWWALGVLPVAILAESLACIALFTLLSFIWFVTELSFEFLPVPFVFFMGVSVWFSLRVRESVLLFLVAVSGLLLWAEFALARGLGEVGNFYDELPEFVLFSASMFILLNALGGFLEQRKPPHLQACGVALRVWVIRFVIFSMVVFGFEAPWEGLLKQGLSHPALMGAILAVAAGVGAAWVIYSSRAASGGLKRAKEALPTLGLIALLVLAFGAVVFGYRSTERVGQGFLAATAIPGLVVTMQVLTNLAAFATSIWLIYRGIEGRQTVFYYTGVATILVMALCRYFDLIGNYLGGAALFAVCGGLLFAAARFWQHENKGSGEGPGSGDGPGDPVEAAQ
jgi:uncharacterized membrane protein